MNVTDNKLSISIIIYLNIYFPSSLIRVLNYSGQRSRVEISSRAANGPPNAITSGRIMARAFCTIPAIEQSHRTRPIAVVRAISLADEAGNDRRTSFSAGQSDDDRRERRNAIEIVKVADDRHDCNAFRSRKADCFIPARNISSPSQFPLRCTERDGSFYFSDRFPKRRENAHSHAILLSRKWKKEEKKLSI